MTDLSLVRLGDKEKIRLDDSGLSPAFFCRTSPVRVDTALVAALEAESRARGNIPIRLCLHEDPASSLHDMIVLIHRKTYAPPHKHLEKSESYHLISGKAAMLIFDDEGMLSDRCFLDSGETFLYRVGKGMFHALVPLSEVLIYHEARPGPFRAEGDSLLPKWAPAKQEQAEGLIFFQKCIEGKSP